MSIVFPSFSPGSAVGDFNYKYPVKKTPEYSTLTFTPTSLRGEVTVSNAVYPRWNFVYDISYIHGDAQTANSAYQALLGLYGAMQGGAGSFLFLDPTDNTVTNQVIATGDGTTTQFPMIRTIGSGSAVLYDLIQNFVGTPTIYVNGVATPSGWTLNQYGTLTFNSAPANGYPIAWSGQFYFQCRFDSDSWDELQEFLSGYWELSQLKFHSILD